MPENIINKVVYGDRTLIDLTNDTVSADKVADGEWFHLPSGLRAQGTCTFDSNTSDATAQASEILATKTAYVNGNKITGTMPNVGAQNATISSADQQVTISQGYHDGSGKVSLDPTELAKIVPENIKSGTSILGVTGAYSGSENVRAVAGSATPAVTAQNAILPSSFGNYNYFSEFTVAAIPYSEQLNAQGGYTASIAAV